MSFLRFYCLTRPLESKRMDKKQKCQTPSRGMMRTTDILTQSLRVQVPFPRRTEKSPLDQGHQNCWHWETDNTLRVLCLGWPVTPTHLSQLITTRNSSRSRKILPNIFCRTKLFPVETTDLDEWKFWNIQCLKEMEINESNNVLYHQN